MINRLRRPATTLVATIALTALGVGGGIPSASAQDSEDIHSGACPNGYVALTYDDGPSATTPALLSALTAAKLRATVFNIGSNAEQNPDLVRAEREAGMWIGNHTYTHPHLTQLAEPALFGELASTQKVLRGITGHRPVLFRPPYGETNDQVRADEARLGLLEVLWTVDSRDWAGASTADIVAAAGALQPGGIILMHDWVQASIDAVPLIAESLAARGLCAGRIGYTAEDISGVGQIFHAVAVRP